MSSVYDQDFRQTIDNDKRDTHRYIEKNGIRNVDKFMKEKITDYERYPIHIGITGPSGVGKSSLINTLRHLRPRDAGATKVGTPGGTVAYTYSNDDGTIIYWDLPSFNTQSLKRERYIDDTKLLYHDALVICSSGRFTQDDIWLAGEASRAKIPFYIVRTKIDQDINNDKEDNPSRHNEKKLLEDVRAELKNTLISQGLRSDKVFLISTKLIDSSKWDYTSLLDDLTNKKPRKNVIAFLSALVASSKSVIIKRRGELQDRISGIVAQIFTETDNDQQVRLMENEVRTYADHFGISDGDMTEQGINARERGQLLTSANNAPVWSTWSILLIVIGASSSLGAAWFTIAAMRAMGSGYMDWKYLGFSGFFVATAATSFWLKFKADKEAKQHVSKKRSMIMKMFHTTLDQYALKAEQLLDQVAESFRYLYQEY